MGSKEFPGKNNNLTGEALEQDIIFGDPFTTGNDVGAPEIGGALTSGSGGNDRIKGLGDPSLTEGDTIFGDAFDMAGSGQGGKDVLLGGLDGDGLFGDASRMFGRSKGGNDTLDTGPSGSVDEGGSGGDSAFGDAGEMHDNTRGGNDLLRGGPVQELNELYLYDDAFSLDGNAKGGNDTLISNKDRQNNGGEGNNLLGEAFYMFEDARGGRDILTGTGGTDHDHLYGDCREMYDNAHGGNDTLRALAGDDSLVGDAGLMLFGNMRGGDDKLDGGEGDDALYGDCVEVLGFMRSGADTIEGGKGDDLMFGDFDPGRSSPEDVVRGVDTFVVRRGDGEDTIGDFEPGRDKLKLIDFTKEAAAALDFADVKLNAADGPGFVAVHGDDTVLDLGLAAGGRAGEDTLTLLGVSNLHPTDILLSSG
jgi:serralysin